MDWAAMMQAGLLRLGLTPAVFWALTPFELQVMLGLQAGAAPMGRAQLTGLLQQYPDFAEEE